MWILYEDISPFTKRFLFNVLPRLPLAGLSVKTSACCVFVSDFSSLDALLKQSEPGTDVFGTSFCLFPSPLLAVDESLPLNLVATRAEPVSGVPAD